MRKMSPVARVKGKKKKGRKNLFQALGDLNTAQVTWLNLCPITLSQHDEDLFFLEDISEDEQSDDGFEEERENGNHIPAGEGAADQFTLGNRIKSHH